MNYKMDSFFVKLKRGAEEKYNGITSLKDSREKSNNLEFYIQWNFL